MKQKFTTRDGVVLAAAGLAIGVLTLLHSENSKMASTTVPQPAAAAHGRRSHQRGGGPTIPPGYTGNVAPD
jgi:hypothetical protein